MEYITQIAVGGFDNNFSYLIQGKGVHKSKAILIDPTGDLAAITAALKKTNTAPYAVLLTHLHFDHIELVEHFKSVGCSILTPHCAPLGKKEEHPIAGHLFEIIHTPGHTPESCCIRLNNFLFTGDTLFARGVGTTAYGGNENELTESLAYLSTLPKNLTLLPGHNYGGASVPLETALTHAHVRPSQTVLDLIKKKVSNYEKAQRIGKIK